MSVYERKKNDGNDTRYRQYIWNRRLKVIKVNKKRKRMSKKKLGKKDIKKE